MKKLIALITLLSQCSTISAQATGSHHASAILQRLKKLNTLGSVLYIAAHPDDENTRLLAYLANEKKFRTGYLSITRGDGGQNLIGKEQGEMLGLIRTQELLAARRTDGAEQFFTRANDFGYSKNPEETLRFWNKDSVLSDMVLVIRQFRPDVIICRFPTTGEGGHGHHTASAILAMEAFDAAADPKRFPEQLKHTGTWKTKRLFWNTFNFGGNNTTAPDQLRIDVGLYNPLLGKSYGEIAAESRSMHKSQGFGSAKQRGSNLEYFKFLKGDSAKTDLFEGIPTEWNRIPAAEKLQSFINKCLKEFDPASPEKILPDLVSLYKLLAAPEKNVEASCWKGQKLKETEWLLLACSGLWLEALAADPVAIPGKEISITAQVICRNKTAVKLNRITYLNSDTATTLELKHNEMYTFKRKDILDASIPFSNPYWLNAKHEPGSYKVSEPALIGKPENDPAAFCIFDLGILDLSLKIRRPLIYKFTDPVKGEQYRPLEILPPATVNFPEKTFVFSNAAAQTIRIIVKANAPNVSGTIGLLATEGWTAEPRSVPFSLALKGDESIVEIKLTPLPGAVNGYVSATIQTEGNSYSKSIQKVEYDHIPYQFILSEAEAGLKLVDLKKTGTAIGYIPGAGDDVPAALKQIGYQVTILDDEILNTSDLSVYDAIITGVRAYNTHERLQVHHSRLMDYVKNGGNLLVQYNTNNRIGPVLAKIGPYPFTISRERVTDENAEVRFLQPEHAALNLPNKISSGDFEGWVQERGVYFATATDKNYEAILQMNDPGEKNSEGSLIIARYGKGNFVYTGLAFFRQLPAGVPGAYRLFVNLISLPPNNQTTTE